VRETDRGWLATAYSDRVTSAAVRVGVDAGTLLGLVISHELGHLLLGSGYHGWSGVMRADWSEEQLTHPREPWRFSALEAAKMKAVNSEARSIAHRQERSRARELNSPYCSHVSA
jgi:hypothetical protein